MYKLLLFLHILSAIVGIGNYTLSGIRASWASKQGGSASGTVGAAEYAAGKVADLFIYAIFVTAIALLLVGDAAEFSDMWVSISFLLYIVAVGRSASRQSASGR